MREWILFALFLIVGISMVIAGVIFTQKEKKDPESVTIYRSISLIGAVLAVGSTIYRFIV